MKPAPWLRDEVAQQKGLSWCVLTLLVAALISTVISKQLSDTNVTAFVAKELNQLKAKNLSSDLAGLTFQSAKVYFSRGWIPELGLSVSGLQWQPSQSRCPAELSVALKADEVAFPVRFMNLLQGVVINLSIRASELQLDLDAIKGCRDVVEPGSPSGQIGAVDLANNGGSSLSGAQVDSASTVPISESQLGFMSERQWMDLTRSLSAVEIANLSIDFERRQKSIQLGGLSLQRSGSAFVLETELLIPPRTVFGEQLPGLDVSAVLENSGITGELSAQLAEGQLYAKGNFKGIQGPNSVLRLVSDLEVSVRDLPLSELSPLLRRTGLISEPLNTRSVWLSCVGKITGEFQTMISTEPIQLKNCQVYGKLGQIQFESGVRNPNGTLRVDRFSLTGLNLGALSKVLPEKDRPEFLRYLVDPGILAGEGTMDSEGLKALSLQFESVRLNPRAGSPTVASTLSFPGFRVQMDRDLNDRDLFEFTVSDLQLEHGEIIGPVLGAVKVRKPLWSALDVKMKIPSLKFRKRTLNELFGLTFEEATQIDSSFQLTNGKLNTSKWSSQLKGLDIQQLLRAQESVIHVERTQIPGADVATSNVQWTSDFSVPQIEWVSDVVAQALVFPPLLAQSEGGERSLKIQNSRFQVQLSEREVAVKDAEAEVIASGTDESDSSSKNPQDFPKISFSGRLDRSSSDLKIQMKVSPPRGRPLQWLMSASGVKSPSSMISNRLSEAMVYEPVTAELKRALKQAARRPGEEITVQESYSAQDLKQLQSEQIRQKLGFLTRSAVQ